VVDSDGRIEELEDDAMLPPPETGAAPAPVPATTTSAPWHVRATRTRNTPEITAPTGELLLVG
jgi:hypothetical protein